MLLTSAFLLFTFACSDELASVTPVEATTLVVEPATATLAPGDTAHLVATPQDDQNNAVGGYEIDWASDDPAVATVDDDGTVVAQTSGATTITATATRGEAPALSGESAVTVPEPASATGVLEAHTSTSGEDPDPDGYAISVDGGAGQPVDASGSLTRAGLPVGEREVALGGVAGNCSVAGSNPRTISIAEGDTASTTFEITCEALTAEPGALKASVSTTGEDLDADGYAVSVDGGAAEPVDVNGSTTFSTLVAGEHEVALSGLQANCAVDGANPKTVTVDAGTTASVSFAVQCASQTGAIDVSVSTSGEDQDTDGYTVTLDGATGQWTSVNGSVTFSDLAAGEHEVALSGLQSNCSVDGANPQSVSVEANATATSGFAVTCAAQTGDLEVSASTSGEDQDTDGYTVTLNSITDRSIGSNGSTTFSDLASGDHTVELTGIQSNCAVGGANPRTVNVPEASTASTSFAVDCQSVGNNLAEVAVPSESEWSAPTAILEPGPPGAWDERLAGPAPASIIKKDNTYYLYYIGAAGDRTDDGGPAERAVGVATSTDGTTWTKHTSNPIISWSELMNLPNTNNNPEEGAWSLAAYVDGDEIILYLGVLKEESNPDKVYSDIHLLTSTDGVNFTKQGIVIKHNDDTFPGDGPGSEHAPAGVYKDNDGTWHLYFNIPDNSEAGVDNWSIVHASGPARDTFTAGEVVSQSSSNGTQHRFGGDVVVLQDNSNGMTVGFPVTFKNGGIDYFSFTDGNFGAETVEATYTWNVSEAAHYLDREGKKWLLFHGDYGDDSSAIYLRTAPAQRP